MLRESHQTSPGVTHSVNHPSFYRLLRQGSGRDGCRAHDEEEAGAHATGVTPRRLELSFGRFLGEGLAAAQSDGSTLCDVKVEGGAWQVQAAAGMNVVVQAAAGMAAVGQAAVFEAEQDVNSPMQW